MLSKKEFESLTKDFTFYNAEFYGVPNTAEAVYQDFPKGFVRTFYLRGKCVFVEYWSISD